MDPFVRDFTPSEITTQATQSINDCKNILNLKNRQSNLKIYHCNIRSISKNFEEFLVYMSQLENCFDIICLTETFYITNINNFNIHGFNLYYNEATLNRNDGTVMYIKKNIKQKVNIVQINEIKALKAVIEISNAKISITALYKPFTNVDTNNFNLGLSQYLQNMKFYDHNIVLGDFNINILDSDEITNEYKDILYHYGYKSLINCPTRVTNENESCIDHIFYKGSATDDLLTPIVLKTNYTDHYSIILKLLLKDNNFEYMKKSKHKIIIDKKLFTNNLKLQNWDSYYACNDPEILSNILIRNINIAKEKASKKIRTNFNIKRKEWISTRLANTIRQRDELYQKIINNPNNTQIKQQYINSRNNINYLIKKEKRAYFQNQTKSCPNNSKVIWNTINNIVKPQRNSANITEINIQETGHKTDDKTKICNEFVNFFSEVGEKLAKDIIPPDTQYKNTTSERSFFLRNVNSDEIKIYISELKNKKAPGFDEVTVELIKSAREIIAPLMAHQINVIFETGICPQHFKIAKIKPLYKSGNKLETKNYRPISLLSNLSKLFEKALKKRINSFLNKFNILSKRQYGFREKTSTDDAIAHVTGKIYNLVDKGRPSICVFIDLAKAFDTISHPLMLKKLYDLGFRGKIYAVLKNYLSNRTQKVSIDNHESTARTVTYGLPQGTVLAPVLFNIYLNDLLKLKIDGEIISFADDTVALFDGETWDEVRSKVSKNIKIIKNWFDQHLLTMNITKTKYLPFCSYKNSLPPYTKIKIENTNTEVEQATQVKYLGIILDAHLKWNYQIEYLCKKLRWLYYTFKQVSTILDDKQRLIIYYGLVEAILKYGIIGWGGVNKTNLDPLIKCHKRILKIMFKKPITFPSKQLFKQYKILNIRQLYGQSLLKYQTKYNPQTTEQRHDYETRKRNTIHIPRAQKTIGTKTFSYLAPRLYTVAQEHLKQSKNKATLKILIKAWIINLPENYLENFIDTGQIIAR